ncbi:hypothetical protein D3C71_1951090 [compost metagenome]
MPGQFQCTIQQIKVRQATQNGPGRAVAVAVFDFVIDVFRALQHMPDPAAEVSGQLVGSGITNQAQAVLTYVIG